MCSFRTGRRDARVIKLDGPRGDHTKSERERLIPCDIIHMWNLKKKKDTTVLIYKTEIDIQIKKTNLWLPKVERGADKSGV